MNRMVNFVICLTLIQVCGCATGSKVIFERAPPGGQDEAVVREAVSRGEIFSLAKSRIMVTRIAPAQDQSKAPAQDRLKVEGSPGGKSAVSSPLRASVVPMESGVQYLVRPSAGWWSKTQLQMTRIPNTDLPQIVGTTFTDLTKLRIEQVGGIVTSLIGGLGFLSGQDAAKECTKRPALQDFVINVDGEVKVPASVPGNPCWRYTMVYQEEQPSVGSVSIRAFDEILSREVGYFPVAACRDVRIAVAEAASFGGGEAHQISARVADPDRVRLVMLPVKGSIKMHPVCGADVSDDGGIDRFAHFNDALAAAMAQAKAIEEKQKAVDQE